MISEIDQTCMHYGVGLLQRPVFFKCKPYIVVVFWNKNGIYPLKWENKNEMDFDGIVIV